jgi:hypothetical protein
MLNAERYAAQLQVPEAVKMTEQDLPVFDPAQLPWIDEAQAAVLGDKVLGQLGAIGSSVEIAEYTRQAVNGVLYMVAPILHKDFWAYSRNPAGTPGYIMVSMTDSDDVRLITQIGGKDIKIRIQPEGHAAWGDKLERVIYNFKSSLLRGDWMFEIDDDLNPYWVVPIYKKTIGWGGSELSSIVIVNAISGETNQYEPEAAPKWVDRVQPVTFIESQLANWGKYRGGYWNTMFGKVGMLQSDPGNALVYKDGECYLFDSLTSYRGSDESTVGFILVNLRNKSVKHFDLAGATEEAAILSALGDDRVKHLRYQGNFPLPTVVDGQYTYFIGLQDPSSHITKMFALVNIEKHQIVGIGNTRQAARMDYLVQLRSRGQGSFGSLAGDLVEISGRVLRIGAYTQGGESYFRIIIEGAEDRLLITDASQIDVPVTQAGDRVKVSVIQTGEPVWSVIRFDNLEF